MRSAPLVLVGIAALLGGAGLWLLGPGSAPPPAPSPGTPPTSQAGPKAGSRGEPSLDAPSLEPRSAQGPQLEPTSSRVLAPDPIKPPPSSTGPLAEEVLPAVPPNMKRLVGHVKLLGSLADGAPSGVSVAAMGDHTPLGSTNTQADGSFAIDVPAEAPQPLKLTFDSAHTYPKNLYTGRPTAERTDLGVVGLAPAQPLGVELGGEGEAPPVGAWGRALPRDAYTPAIEAGTTTATRLVFSKVDDLGLVYFGAKGHRTITVRAGDLRSRATDDPEGLAHVTLPPGIGVDIHLVDTEGQPLAGARVQLLPEDPFGGWDRSTISFESAELHPAVLSGTTGPDGQLHFGELNDERYFMRAEGQGYLRGLDRVIAPGDDKEVELALESAPLAKFRVLALDPELGHGVPIKSTRVGLLCAQERLWSEITPDGQGEVRQFMEDTRAWTIEAWAPGYRLQTEPLIPALSGDAPPQVIMLFPAELDLVHIVDEVGRPLEEARLTGQIMSKVRRSARIPGGAPWALEPERVAAGVFRVAQAGEEGAPVYTASAPERTPASWDASSWPEPAKDAPAGTKDLVFALSRMYALRVLVRDAEGHPSAGAQVYVTQNGKGSPKPWVTDAGGEVVISGLPPDRVTLQARGPGGEISPKLDLAPRDDEDAQVILDL